MHRLSAGSSPAEEKASGPAKGPLVGMGSRVPPESQGQAGRPPPNHIYVGTKRPMMDYAMMVLMRLTEFSEVVVKARGMAISRTVDVAEVVTKRLGSGQFKIQSIRIGTDTVLDEAGNPRDISTIEVIISKAQ
ncbi:MAG: DNA-binding protein [Nitrososphaerales archaeon]|nr:DNA-binding protein [Nitrososphaerales archaeon]